MATYITRRWLQLIVVLSVVSVIIFAMVRCSGIDPVAVMLGGSQSSPEAIANIRHAYHLDQSLPSQYRLWISGVLYGDFDETYRYHQSVALLIKSHLPVTLGLVGLASLIAILTAVPIGIISAVKADTPIDRLLSVLSLFLVSCPVFLTCVLMIIAVSILSPDYSFTGSFNGFGEYLQRIALPAVALALFMIALLARVTRSAMLEQLQAPYALTAAAKGLPPATIILKHCFKNAMIPVITVASLEIGAMLAGSALVENVFSLPGIGSLLIDSIKVSDYPVIQAVTLIMVTIFLLINLSVDIICAMIDPRIRIQPGH